jgi:ribosomal protein L31
MFWNRYHVIFFCSSSVDEVWIRSTALCLSKFKVEICIIIYHEKLDEILSFYKSTGIKVIFETSLRRLNKFSAKILVSASTNIKKSVFSSKIKYLVHMPHSLVSLHGVYPHDAFDSYNTLFACTPYHIKEFKKIVENRNICNARIFETGYGKLDILLEGVSQSSNNPLQTKHILIAPSWGNGNILETIGYDLILKLLKQNYSIILRPHSMFYLDKKNYLKPFLNLKHKNFKIEQFSDSHAIYTSELLITDFSGIAFEYVCIRNRKIIFVDTMPKILNTEFKSYNLPLFESAYRDVFGLVVPCELNIILKAIEKEYAISSPFSEFLFNRGKCGVIASHQIMELLES